MNISTGIGSATSTDPYVNPYQYPYQYVNQYQYRRQYGAEYQYGLVILMLS